jgi:fatty acid desaturase
MEKSTKITINEKEAKWYEILLIFIILPLAFLAVIFLLIAVVFGIVIILFGVIIFFILLIPILFIAIIINLFQKKNEEKNKRRKMSQMQ